MERYQPDSPFLLDILAGLVPLSGGEFGEANLNRLIAMTRDEDRSNRDWATFLLAQLELRAVPAVRDALLRAATDEDEYVRAEAIWGLAHIDRDLALPLVKKALAADHAATPIFEAAEILAEPSLVEDLRPFTRPPDDAHLDQIANRAFRACKTGTPPIIKNE